LHLQFYSILFLDILINRADINITENSFHKALGNVISNAKDWNLGRKAKLKVPDIVHEENDKESNEENDNTDHIEEVMESEEI